MLQKKYLSLPSQTHTHYINIQLSSKNLEAFPMAFRESHTWISPSKTQPFHLLFQTALLL